MDNIENSYDKHVPTTVDDMESSHDKLRRSKRQKKEVSFGDDFYTYLIENESSSYFDKFLPLMHYFGKKSLKLSLTLF